MAIAQPGLWKRHEFFEKNSILLLIGILIVVAIGGLIEIVPLFYLKSTIEAAAGVRPYTPLELAGRNIYVREGCYLCHSQMVRPMRDEVERYGHFSLAAESMYDHPFQWGSKRTGPDLARVGGKYSNAWHREHLKDPRAVVPGSIMPAYVFLDRPLDAEAIADDLTANAKLGVPYGPDMILRARGDLVAQLDPDGAEPGLQQRYPGAVLHAPGEKGRATELDALVAYLQVLGTMVDFKLYDDKTNLR